MPDLSSSQPFKIGETSTRSHTSQIKKKTKKILKPKGVKNLEHILRKELWSHLHDYDIVETWNVTVLWVIIKLSAIFLVILISTKKLGLNEKEGKKKNYWNSV